MPVQYDGIPSNLVAGLPTAIGVSSSLLSVITTASAHGLMTGDTAFVNNPADAALLGSWDCLVLSATTVQVGTFISGAFVAAAGTTSGGAQGTLYDQGFGQSAALPTDNDPPNAASVNVSLEALFDRTAEIWRTMGWSQRVHPGGSLRFDTGAALVFQASTFIESSGSGVSAPRFLGNYQIGDGSTAYNWQIAGGSQLTFAAGTTAFLDAGATIANSGEIVYLTGSEEVWTGGQIVGTPILSDGATLQVGVSGVGIVDVFGAGSYIRLRSGTHQTIDNGAGMVVGGVVTFGSTGSSIWDAGSGLWIKHSALYVQFDTDIEIGAHNFTAIDVSGGGVNPGGKVTRKRFTTATTGAQHINITQGERFFIPTTTGALVLVLDTTGAVAGDEAVIYYNGNGGTHADTWTVSNGSGAVGSFGDASAKAECTFDGAAWSLWLTLLDAVA